MVDSRLLEMQGERVYEAICVHLAFVNNVGLCERALLISLIE